MAARQKSASSVTSASRDRISSAKMSESQKSRAGSAVSKLSKLPDRTTGSSEINTIPKLPQVHHRELLPTTTAKTADPRLASSDAEVTQTWMLCPVCSKQLRNPHLLPCLHVFCLRCLQDECTKNSRDKFFCPVCVMGKDEDPHSYTARPWHTFEKILEKEEENEALQKRLAELPASEICREDDWDNESPDSDLIEGHGGRKLSLIEPPSMFPCHMHTDKLADTYCTKCEQLACPKCVSSFHRRCPNFSTIQEAVDLKRNQLDRLHNRIAANLVQCQNIQQHQNERVQEVEDMRMSLLLGIKAHRTELVNMILAKEKELSDKANALMNQMKEEAARKEKAAKGLADAFHRQLDLLDLSFSVKGEGELLTFLPTLACRVEQDVKTVGQQTSEELHRVNFVKDEECLEAVRKSDLGSLHTEGLGEKSATLDKAEGKTDLRLSLLTSFHGGTIDDTAEPLLTDLVLLGNGDIIMADRDNKCVKKFNLAGKLLTRVIIESVPSRIATVSQGRAVVSVMNKKALYFLSLLGTIRVLNSIRVKKIYSFLTSVGDGLLVAGTNRCDCIDIITEKGVHVKTIYTQKSDRASISRPMYITSAEANSRNGHSDSASGTQRNGTDSAENHLHGNEGGQNRRGSQAADMKTPSAVSISDILVTDSGKRIMFRLKDDGTTVFTFKSNDEVTVECPLGVTVHDCGLTLMADRDSNAILLLDSEGHFRRKILTSDEGLVKPCGIYTGYRGHVALTQVDGMVKIYSSQVVYL